VETVTPVNPAPPSPQSTAGGQSTSSGQGDPTSSVEHVISGIERFFEQLPQDVQKLQQAIDKAIAEVPTILRALAEPLIWSAQEAMKGLHAAIQKLMEVLDGLWKAVKSPITLYQASNRWIHDVYGPMTTVGGEVDNSTMGLEAWWKGAAAEGYKVSTARQQGAAEQVAGIAKETRESLMDFAMELAAVYVALLALLVSFLITLVASALAALGIVTAPPAAMVSLADALKTFAGVAGLAGVAMTLTLHAAQNIQDPVAEMDNSSNLIKGRWPSATANGVSLALPNWGTPRNS
jgi:uncharacterized protein YukE